MAGGCPDRGGHGRVGSIKVTRSRLSLAMFGAIILGRDYGPSWGTIRTGTRYGPSWGTIHIKSSLMVFLSS